MPISSRRWWPWAQGDIATTNAQLAQLDAALAGYAATEPEMQTVPRARGTILVVSETLAVHAVYFGSGTQG